MCFSHRKGCPFLWESIQWHLLDERLKCGSLRQNPFIEQGIQPGADYTVVLRAADLYWSYTGQRIFSVSANGVPVLTNYDVIAEAGTPHPYSHCAISFSQCKLTLNGRQGFRAICQVTIFKLLVI